MFTMSPEALTVGQAETYYQEKYARDDYYTEDGTVAGQWFGRGALALELSGEASVGDFRALLRGLNPRTGEELVTAADHNGTHRAGWDGTFIAPKSVSIQSLAAGDTRLIEAHRAAVEATLGQLEEYALTRRRGGSEWVVTGNLVTARFEHIAARPAEGAPDGQGPDPHLHTHVVFLNTTRRDDGAWRALDPVEIYCSQTWATAVYRAELANQVQKLGYRIETRAGDGGWEITGYSREHVMAFSLRRQDIERRLAELGVEGARAAQIAAYYTRQSKQPQNERELRTEWRNRGDAIGIPLDVLTRQAYMRGPLEQRELKPILDAAISYGAAHATEREAVMDRRELEAAALQDAMGNAVLAQVRAHADNEMPDLIALAAGFFHPQGGFTTTEMVALERDNLDLMHSGQETALPIARPEEIARSATRRGLAADQAKVTKITLGARDWITAIDGRAGAAKTTTVGAIREMAEERGYVVRGFGPTSGSVKALTQAGIPARTVASLLENPLPERHGRELWIVDETSLLATRQVNRLLHFAKDAGIDRVVFVGDQRQHHAVEAGRPIYQMQQGGMTTARLDTIRRQRDPELRRVVELAAVGDSTQAAQALFEQQRINQITDSAQRYRAIATDYLRSHEAGLRTLVISPANEERRELNRVIRQLLVEHGRVASEGYDHSILVSHDLTRAQRAQARNYQAGYLIRFNRGSGKLGIGKGEYVAVEAVDSENNRLTVKNATGARLDYRASQFRGVEVFRPEQRLLGVGDRIQFRARDRTLKIANGEFATISSINGEQTRLLMDDGREIAAATARLRHIDHGYASTSHSSQGATVDRVIVNIDTERSAKLVNERQFYVSISRARYDARVYTDDASALARVIGREQRKHIALEHLTNAQRPNSQKYRQAEVEDPVAARLKQRVRQEQKVTQGRGIRW